MNRIIKIVFALVCTFTLFPIAGSAQGWRVGFEGGPGSMLTNVTLIDKDEHNSYDTEYYLDGKFQAVFEYILPRQWFPNYLAGSVRLGFGAAFYDRYFPYYKGSDDDYDWDYWDDNSEQNAHMDIPLEAEIKYLFTNNVRAYANVGLAVYGNVDYGYWGVGSQFGIGFEFGFFRLGYKCVHLPTAIEPRVKSWNNAHMITYGIMLNGNQYFKKKSKLKMY